MKKISIVLLIAIMLFASLFTACASEDGLVTIDEEKANEQVVASVDGVDITKGEVIEYIEMAAVLSGYPADYYFTADMEEQIEDIKVQVLDLLIENETLNKKAAEFELDQFTAEDLESLQSEVDMFLDQNEMTIEMQVMQEYEAQDMPTEGEEFEAEVQRRVDEWMETFGGDVDSIMDMFKTEEIYSRLQEYLFKDVDISEEEVRAFYDTSLEEQQKTLSEMPEMAATYQQMGATLVYQVSDIHNVRHILINFYDEDEDGAQIPLDEQEQALIDDASSKYSLAADDAERKAALAILAPSFQRIQPQVDEVLAKIEEGVDFAELIEQYGEDPGMMGNTEGYAVVEGEGMFVPEFEAASVALTEPLQVSEPVQSTYGVHIIQLIDIDEAGPIEYEEIKEQLKQQLLNEEKSNLWDENYTLWMDSTDRVEYVNRLKN